MKLLTSQKNKIYNYITSKHYFSPNQFKLEEHDSITIIKFLNSPYYFKFINDTEYVGFFVNYSPGQENFLEVTPNVSWELGFQHLVSWLMNLERELEVPNLWERFEMEISGINLRSNFDNNTKFTVSEYEIISKKLDSISEGILSIPLLEQQQQEILINLERLNEFAKELNKFDWKNLFIGTFISIIIQLNVTPENASELWKLIKNIFNDYFLS